MYLSHLALTDFRNFKQLELPLGPGLFLFYGENAQGKTNLLEAITMLTTAHSFHTTSDREVMNWDSEEHLTRLRSSAVREEGSLQIELVIFDPNAQAGSLSPTPGGPEKLRKRIKVNGVVKKSLDLFGLVTIVLFAPTDLSLVDGPPEERRRFLDRSLCQVRAPYCQALLKYRKIVTQRSALLKRIRENQEDPRMLDYLDEKLTELANLLMYERQNMIAALNQEVGELQLTLSGGKEHLQIVYRPSFQMNPAWNVVESLENYRAQLRAARRREIHQGACSLGPHRDDLEFLVNGVNMLSFGSRGQQRTVALAAKLAELSHMRQVTGEEPILLLDDVFSELDLQRRAYLLRQVLHHQQVLMTTTDFSGFPPEILEKAHQHRVVQGTLPEM
ncbi:MAG TPA: DNA replication/repair protein RecF [Ktedonobacteraceae bacterium]|jgi:DNA replication and repair protein RecF